ncbi:basic phospholipase A2 PA-12A [Neocloeon triangulifer]|uniref:basic phospholipase A2 PA-12A n=1 Tax=Neocloeon triangulifer TaxID=2078957 RepID=UPI00286F10AF|nr:basic phospholipase A2 PA-12A [Neocloeon triangulifer]
MCVCKSLVAPLVLAIVLNTTALKQNDSDFQDEPHEELLLARSHDPWGSHDSQEPTHAVSPHRSKRHVVHLYNMVSCATGCDPLSYKGYGCYCGFLGSGFVTDGIDKCCKIHDWCYQSANCPMFMEYFIPYYWKCIRGHEPICAIEHGEWGGGGSCAQMLCECDRQLSICLRRYPCPHTKALCHSSPLRLLQNVFML